MPQQFLQFGSEIALKCIENHDPYVLTSAGYADRRLLLRSSDDHFILLGYERSVFRIEPADTTTESNVNGNVTLGSCVVLRHSFSNLVVAVQRRETAELDRSCCNVVLKEIDLCGTSCRFRLLPRYKMQHVGEPVQFGDEVRLQVEDTNMFLHVTSVGMSSVTSHLHWALETSMEVNCSDKLTSWTIVKHQVITTSTKPAIRFPLRFNELITVTLSERDLILSSFPHEIVTAPKVELPEIEQHRPTAGGRLRRMSSQQQLSMNHEDISTPADQTPPHPATKPLHVDIEDKAVFLARDESKINCISMWQFEADNPSRGGIINIKDGLRIRHAATGRYLRGCQNPNGSITVVLAEPSEDETFLYETLFVLNHVLNELEDPKIWGGYTHVFLRHVASGCFLRPSEDAVSTEEIQCALVVSCHLQDAICIRHVPEEAGMTFKHFLSLVEQLHLYCSHFHDKENVPSMESKSTQKVILLATAALSSLIRYCTNSSDENPLEREGLPIQLNQKMLFDLNVHGLLFKVISCPFSPHGTVPSSAPFSGGWIKMEEILKPEYSTIHMVCRLCYRLLKQMCKGSSFFSSKLQFLVDFMQTQEGYKFHVADTLLEIFTESADMPAETTEGMAKHFVRLLEEKGQSAGYVRFLSRLCVVQECGISRNQRIVCDQLLSKTKVLMTFVQKDGLLHVNGIPKKKESVLINDLLTSGESKTVKFFQALLELFASMVRGMNDTVQNAVGKLVSRETTLSLLRLPSILPKIAFIKGCATRIALDLYVKRDLSYNRPKPRNFLIIAKNVFLERYEPDVSEEALRFMEEVKAITLDIVKENISQPYDDPDTNECLRAIMFLWVTLVEERKFTVEEEQEIIRVILLLLDYETDVPSRDHDYFDNFDKHQLTEHSRVLFDSKMAAVLVLKAIFTNAVRTTSKVVLERFVEDSSVDADGILKEGAKALYENVFVPEKVLPYVLGLAKHECEQLSNTALEFLVDLCSFRKRCTTLLKETRDLQLQTSVNVYYAVETISQVLNSNIASTWEIVDSEKLLKALDDLVGVYNAIIPPTTKDHTPSREDSVTRSDSFNTPSGVKGAKRRWGIIRNLVRTSAFAHMVQRRKEGVAGTRHDDDEVNVIISHWNVVDMLAALVEHCSIISSDDPMLERTLKVLTNIVATPYCARMLSNYSQLFLAGLETTNSSSCLRILVSLFATCDETTVSHDIVHQFVEFLGNDEEFDDLIFDSLEHIVFQEYPIHSNQRTVFHSLWDLGKTTMIDKPTAAWKGRDLHSNRRVVTLLMKSCLGNSITRTAARRLISSKSILSVLVQEPALPFLHQLPYIRFLGVVYFGFDSDVPQAESIQTQIEWTTSTLWWEVVEALSFSLQKRTSAASIFLTQGFLPTLELYFRTMFHVPTAIRTPSIGEQVTKLCKALLTGWKCHKGSLRASIENTFTMIIEYGEKIRIPTEIISLKKIHAAEAVEASREEVVEEPVTTVLTFVKKLDEETEESPEDFAPLTEAFGGEATQGSFLKKVITHLGEKEFTQSTMTGVLKAMQFDLVAKEDNEEEMIAAQNRYDNHGLTPVLIKLCDVTDEDVFGSAIALGIAELEGGNSQVQATLLSYFVNTQEDFFSRVRNMITKARVNALQIENTRSVAQAYCLTKENLVANYKFMESLFRFLQLMCEGHNLEMQNYITNQYDNVHNVNTLREVLFLLQDMVQAEHLSKIAMDVLDQTFNLLTEVCQGPCRGNQFVLVQNNVCKFIHVVLTGKTFANRGDEEWDGDLQNLKVSAVTTLLALLEGCSDHYIPSVLLKQVSVPDLCQLIEECSKFDDDEHTDLKYNLVILLHQVDSFRRFIQDNDALTTLQNAIKMFENLSDMIGRIEIQRENSLEAVFFRIPDISMMLTETTKQELQWAVDRSTQSSKLSDFVDKSDSLIYEMEHYYEVEKTCTRWCPKRVLSIIMSGDKWDDGMVVLAFVINFFLMFLSEWTLSIKMLSLIQIVITFHLLLLDCVLNAPLTLYIKKKELDVESLSWWMIAKSCGSRQNAWYRAFFFIISCCSFVISPYLLAVHLLAIVPKSTILQNVTTAVTANGTSLVLTAALGMVMAYLFSIIGYFIFKPDFDADGVKENEEFTCETLPRCFIHILTSGIRNGGGVGDVMKPVTWNDDNFSSRTLFDFSFWIVMIIIFLNILFGIILDTFASLRDERNKKEEDMRTICFICGLEASNLERQGIQFSKHCETEHNVWHYLYFMHHLKRKDKDNYTGQESYVCEKLSNKDINFFPTGQCLSLNNHSQESAAEDDKESTKQPLVIDEATEELLGSIVRDSIVSAMGSNGGGGVQNTPGPQKPVMRNRERSTPGNTPRDTTPRVRANNNATAILREQLARLQSENDELTQEIAKIRQQLSDAQCGAVPEGTIPEKTLTRMSQVIKECGRLAEGPAVDDIRHVTESTKEMTIMVRSMMAMK
eukprot:PhF_6_TR44153/c0_g1_i1/m.67576/K04958/ITPR1; inositol 1,4,5-triphosphate receptor type 1